MEKFRRSKESASISLFVLIACLFFVLILGGLYIKSINKLQNQEQSISKIQENYNRNLATAEDWADENSGIKVDLSQATATEPDVLEGQTFFSGDENIKIGIMPNRGDIQKAKNQYFYTHSDGVTYLVSWMPGGYYRGWQTASDGTMCAETWTPQARIAEAAGLTSAKLLAGQTVMGVTGTATSDATASASQILSGQTAYVNGSKVTGTMATKGSESITLNPGGSYTFATSGYYCSGNMTVSVKYPSGSLTRQFDTNHDNWTDGRKSRARLNINVSVSGNTVRVYGYVSSWIEGGAGGGGYSEGYDYTFYTY